MIRSKNYVVLALSLISLLITNGSHAQNEVLVDFADSPGATKTTIFNTPNCIAGFNQTYGTNIIEGRNVINGEQIFVGLGRATNEFNADGKNALEALFFNTKKDAQHQCQALPASGDQIHAISCVVPHATCHSTR